MPDIADNRDSQFCKVDFVLPNRQQVEQPLGWMRYVCLASIQDTHVITDMAGNVGRHADTGITNYHELNLHRLERVYRVQDALAFLARRRIHIEIEYVCTEALASQFKRRPRSCAGFEKKVADRAALK